MSRAKVKATIYLPEDVHRRLKIRAAEERSCMTDLVLQAISELLADPPPPASDSSKERIRTRTVFRPL